MKKIKLFALLMMSGLAFTACEEENGWSEFKPAEDTETVTFEENYWNALIDNPQYFGPMLYGDGTYNWKDATTSLSGGLTNAWGDGMFWGGGVAISNYLQPNVDEPVDYNQQLAVPVSNGSKNFAVVYCGASVEFADGKARQICSMDVIPTSYLLSVIKLGDGYAKALTETGDYLNLVITGYKGETATGTVKVYLAADGGFMNKWYTTDLSALGQVTKLSFSMEGSDTSAYSIKAPAYFAFDNVVIKK